MFNIWTTLSTLKAINLTDWDQDKEMLEQEQLDDYALCFAQMEKSIEQMSQSIDSILKKSARYDLEHTITQGKLQIPPYIFLQITGTQQGPVSKYQHQMIDRYLDAQTLPKDAGIDRYEYRSGLTADPGSNTARDALYAAIGLTESHCGTFWDKFIESLYEADDADADFESIVRSYGEICWRFALLGGCGSEETEAVFQLFKEGLQKQLEDDAAIKRPGGEEKLTADMTAWMGKMKGNCRRAAENGGEEEQLILETFHYFIMSMIIGLLESVAADETEKREAFQYFLNSVGIDFKIDEADIYQEEEERLGIRQVFDKAAGSWEQTDFWKAHQAASNRADSPELFAEFTELAKAFLQAAEYLLHYKFPALDLSGKAEAYLEEALENMESELFAENAKTAGGRGENGDTLTGAEAKEVPAGQKKGNPYEEVSAHNIEKYGASQEKEEGKKGKGFIATGIAAAAVLCGIVLFLLLH